MNDSLGQPGDRRTFSQRFDYAPLPEPMRLEEISSDLRREIWNATREVLLAIRTARVGCYYFDRKACRFIERVLGSVLKTAEDEIDTEYGAVLDLFKVLILQPRFSEVLDLVEMFSSEEPKGYFANRIADSFERHAAAYWLDATRRPYQFFPRSNRAQGDTTREAINAVRDAGMEGANTHLRQAAEHINGGRFADSVKDSILAVESVARIINPKAEKTLGPALNSLEKCGVIRHPVLKQTFSKLYGYTSDEQGIRHALLDKAAPAVDIDEAMFMFGACASFAAYLANKHLKSAGHGDGDQ